MAALTLEKMAAGGMYDQLGGRLPPLLDRRALAGAALREDAVRQRAAGRRVRRGPPGHRARRLRPRRARDAGLPAARDDRARRRLLFGDRRRLGAPRRQIRGGRSSSGPRRRSAQVLGAGRRDGTIHRAITASPRRETSKARTSSPSRAPDDARASRAGAAARRALRRARAAVTAVSRRQDPRGLERPGDLGAAVAGRLFDEPRYVAAAARAATFLLDRCARAGALARSAKDGRAGGAGFLDDYAFVCAGPHRPLRGDASSRAGCGRRSRSPTRPSALFADPSGRLVHDRRRSRAADRAREARLRRRRAFGDVGRAAQRAAPRDVHVATIAGARSPTAPSPPAPRRWPRTRSRSPRRCWRSTTAATSRARLRSSGRATRRRRRARPAGRRPRARSSPTTRSPRRRRPTLAALGKLIPFIADKTAVGGRATAYVCVRGRCELPVHEPEALAALLHRRVPYPPAPSPPPASAPSP